MKRRRKNESNFVAMSLKNLAFVNGTKSLTVVINNGVSAFETVRDILTEHIVVFKGGKRLNYERPIYNPMSVDIPVETRKSLLKELKSQTKKLCGSGYRPTLIGMLSDGELIN